jgi:hypothetical protein
LTKIVGGKKMAVVSRVRITGGSVSVDVDISYRFYVPGNDPWRRVSGGNSDFPAGGEWENRAIHGPTSEARLYTSSEGQVAILDRFRRITVGATGTGSFLASGYTMPEFSEITWEVLSVS